jgi:hypothetical protein
LTGFVKTTCASALLCDEEYSQCDICSPDAYSCDGKDLHQCDPSGQTNPVTQTCKSAALCSAANGKCLCEVGEFRCSGSVLQQCATDQLGFENGSDCGDITLCDAANGVCITP